MVIRSSYLTMEKNTIRHMLVYIGEYELVKKKVHNEFKTARSLFKSKGICYQNFIKGI